MSQKVKITEKQQKTLDFIKKYIKERGYPPSLRDICAHLGISAPKNAAKHLDALERKGFIRRVHGRSRAIEVIEESEGGMLPPHLRIRGVSAGRAFGPADAEFSASHTEEYAESSGEHGDAGGRTTPVPIVGRVRAGTPTLAVEDIEGYARLDANIFKCAGTFMLRASGDSMIGAGIDDGDLLLVRPGSSAEDRDIVIALIEDDATVKRLVTGGKGVILRPENPLMDDIYVDPARPFQVIGTVVNVIKSV